MKKNIMITIDAEIFNYFEKNHIKKSEFINEILKEKLKNNNI